MKMIHPAVLFLAGALSGLIACSGPLRIGEEASISSGSMVLRPQGAPDDADGLKGTFGFLNEQVVWFTHQDSDGRSALRVPEFARWKGWNRPKASRGYQTGQRWHGDDGSLFYENCRLNYPVSPGTLAARVEFIDAEIVRVSITVENRHENPLPDVSCHLCWNHHRHVPLAKKISARAGESWTDFGRYVTRRPYRNFTFDREQPATHDGPPLTVKALFTEYPSDGGVFGAFIAAPSARTLMSNAGWPCTDLSVSFGTINPGESATRSVYLGMGPYGREHWLKVVRALFEDPAKVPDLMNQARKGAAR